MGIKDMFRKYFRKGNKQDEENPAAALVPTEIISPTFEKKRYPCPFYGFYTGPGALLDQKGNQCALMVDSYSPCQMGLQEQTPDWNKCRFNNEKNKRVIETIIEESRIYPDEFFPAGAKSWKGIPLKVFADYVMGQGEARQ